VDFGIQTGQQHRTYAEILSLWRLAEHLGYRYGWLYDHLVPVGGDLDGDVYEAWSLLSSLLSRTERIRGGVLVSCVMFRRPAILAKAASTVDHASGGRVEFGIGACWNPWEADLYGVEFPPLRERLVRLDEAIHVVRTMWDPGQENFEGRYYKVSGAHFSPQPLQRPHPPIWIGGFGRRIPEIIARQADGWNAIFLSLDEYRERLDVMRRACEAIGRDPSTLRLSFGQRVSVDADEKTAETRARMQYEQHGVPFDEQIRSRVIFGTPARVADQIAAFRDLGVEQFIVWHEPPFDAEAEDQLRAFAETVFPLVG
jgi:F420-dependent oxidoreductase-like protein